MWIRICNYKTLTRQLYQLLIKKLIIKKCREPMFNQVKAPKSVDTKHNKTLQKVWVKEGLLPYYKCEHHSILIFVAEAVQF